jgi:protein involved in polysaccharide export with SLBB domain
MGGGEVSGKSLRAGKIRGWRQFLFLSAVFFLSSGQGVAQRSGSDIVADNLDRVAATAEQILDVLERDAGLMVEMKRVLARDAGAGGELLEESDLSDAAVSERLRQELRTRVLATRLLQRYGYLLPKVSPESEVAAEQKVRQQAREREAAREPEPRAVTRPEQATSCDFERSVECGLPETPGEQEIPRGNPAPARPNRAEVLAAPGDGGADTNLMDGTEALLVSLPHAGPGNRFAPPETSATGKGGYAVSPGEPLPAELVNTTSHKPERRVFARAGIDLAWPAAEPVRMVRKPNPYASAPSLYDLYVQASPGANSAERFGLDVFRSGTPNPDLLPMDLPVGPDYVVGPGDSLSIDLWGGVAQRLLRTVDHEGRLALPEVGPLLVSGKSLGEVQEAVQRVLRTQYRDVSADVSLLRLRTVRVYVVGEVAAPGAYDVSSLSTPLNALFAAGGVTSRGSLRRLEHYRGKQLVEEVDAYDLLLHGIRGDAKRLENGDSLRVPPFGASVTVDGMVRRPALYELRGENNLGEVLELAGGILPAAALRHIEVQRLEAHEKRTMLSLEMGESSDPEAVRGALEKFTVQDGDEIHIFPIAPYNTRAVYLEGHVLRPGRYSYHEGMKLGDLLLSYKDLLPEPATQYGEIIRIAAPDNRPVVHSFNLGAALANPESGPKLEPLDTVRIFGKYDLEAAPEFAVFGEVRAPGKYRSSGKEHLRDAIYQAGGTTSEAWLESAQLFRAMPDGTTKVFSISLREALAGEAANNILIEGSDRILIHRQLERVNPPSVYVRGEVVRPGRYPLVLHMNVSDLVRTAGGLLRSANPESGDLSHYANSGSAGGPQGGGAQPVQLASALAGESAADLPLRDGDVLTVPQRANWKDVGITVSIRGEVGKPGVYGIQPGERLSSLLQRAGGLLPTAFAQAAVFERIEVHEMQQKSRQELIQRIEQESTVVKTTVTTTGTEEAALQQAGLQQRQRILEALRKAPISGRLVVRIRPGEKDFLGSPDDVELRGGDTLEIPKRPGFVTVVGQVYNSNAITFTPGKNAGWYLSRAGGATSLANKKAIFILRTNGAVTSGSSAAWTGGMLSSAIWPGDTIVVPEKITVGGSGWKNVLAIAQIAQSAALSAAVAGI